MSERQRPPNPYVGPGKFLRAALRRGISRKNLFVVVVGGVWRVGVSARWTAGRIQDEIESIARGIGGGKGSGRRGGGDGCEKLVFPPLSERATSKGERDAVANARKFQSLASSPLASSPLIFSVAALIYSLGYCV